MTYEYICTACGYQWEAEQSISASPLKDCPVCNKATAKRQVSGGTGFLLKGGGWYADGYGSSGSSSSAGASTSGGSASGASSSSSSESKTSGAGKGSDSGSSGSKDGAGGGSGAKPSTPAS